MTNHDIAPKVYNVIPVEQYYVYAVILVDRIVILQYRSFIRVGHTVYQ